MRKLAVGGKISDDRPPYARTRDDRFEQGTPETNDDMVLDGNVNPSRTGGDTPREIKRGGRMAIGGRVGFRRGGGVFHGSVPMTVEGKQPSHHRLDRPGRKRGGGVGSDALPLTSAARLTAPDGGGE